jgi:transposase InsO family protein
MLCQSVIPSRVSSAPGARLLSRIGYILVMEGWLYLAYRYDLFSRTILNWKISD